MTDRELLEAAARAAGMEHMRYAGPYMGMVRMLDPSRPETTGSVGPNWNPLTSDGDALRLAVALRMELLHNAPGESPLWVSAVVKNTMIHGAHEFESEDQRQDATRRAIVRAAAVLGAQSGAPQPTGPDTIKT